MVISHRHDLALVGLPGSLSHRMSLRTHRKNTYIARSYSINVILQGYSKSFDTQLPLELHSIHFSIAKKMGENKIVPDPPKYDRRYDTRRRGSIKFRQ